MINILHIGGGDSYSNREDFLQALKTSELRDLPSNIEYRSWSKWLREELGELVRYDKPSMPNTDNAHYDEWKIWFERHLEHVTGPIILIGHSLGAMFLAKYVSENEVIAELRGLFLLAGPCGEYDDGAGNDCGSFTFDVERLSEIVNRVKNIHILHSKDDFVVPYEHALKYKAALPEATLLTFEDKNHFLIEEFPELLENILAISASA